MATDPLFGRFNWSYVTVQRGPVIGPQPRLAQGTGKTGKSSYPGTAAQLPGYVSDNSYHPQPLEYAPKNNENFGVPIPRTINTGDNGRQVVGKYNPHDFTPGQRFFHHMRSAHNWQVVEFPPRFRDTIQYQQVQKYSPYSRTISASPLVSNQYFLGYQVQPDIQRTIGQNALGYMGSM